MVMGIINITDDSFYAGSRAVDADPILQLARRHQSEGASIIDLGAVSSRPGAIPLSIATETERLIKACDIIRSDMPDIKISIDTNRSKVLQALEPYNINMVNDISGGQEDEEIWDWAAQHRVPYVLMHMRGTSATMPHLAQYQDITKDILDFFIERIPRIKDKGVHDIIIDIGIGFAKTIEQNFYLLKHLQVFHMLELPILIGVSRKSLVWKTLNITPAEALNGTTALHMHCLTQGVSILRVHDVQAAIQTINLWQKLQG